jgi:RHS repeat-associated protein
VTDTLTTDAWGVEVAATGATVIPYRAFGAWGYERDAASRLYVRARHLRVDLGRWVSRDPARCGGGVLERYAFVANSPGRWIDPDGRYRRPMVITSAVAQGTGAGACTTRKDNCYAMTNPLSTDDCSAVYHDGSGHQHKRQGTHAIWLSEVAACVAMEFVQYTSMPLYPGSIIVATCFQSTDPNENWSAIQGKVAVLMACIAGVLNCPV